MRKEKQSEHAQLCENIPCIKKRCWASIKDSVAVRDRNEIEEFVHDFSPKQHRKRERGNESTNIVIRQEVDTS